MKTELLQRIAALKKYYADERMGHLAGILNILETMAIEWPERGNGKMVDPSVLDAKQAPLSQRAIDAALNVAGHSGNSATCEACNPKVIECCRKFRDTQGDAHSWDCPWNPLNMQVHIIPDDDPPEDPAFEVVQYGFALRAAKDGKPVQVKIRDAWLTARLEQGWEYLDDDSWHGFGAMSAGGWRIAGEDDDLQPEPITPNESWRELDGLRIDNEGYVFTIPTDDMISGPNENGTNIIVAGSALNSRGLKANLELVRRWNEKQAKP